jgi:phospholipid/cholesterol/gamma-HCH transport system permease protein
MKSLFSLNFAASLGRSTVGLVEDTFNVFIMIYLSFRATFRDQQQGLGTIFRVVSAQIYFTGWQAMPIVAVIALAVGSLFIMQSSYQLNLLGGSEMIGNLMVMIVVRELAPLLVAIVVVARSGTAVASEIGNMRVNREIEALEVMGIHPLSYIVFPRILGGVVSVLCLAFYFNVIALIGGFLVSRLVHSMSFSFYMDSLARAFDSSDVFVFILKNSFSGAIIFTVCCYNGLQVQGSPHEVPQATTRAVVRSIGYVVAFNMIVTFLVYLKHLVRLGII